MPEEPQRLSKIVAAQVPCSRREAEQYIAEGWVRVDGAVVDVPQSRVAPGQRVELDATAQLQAAEPATFLVHKPAGMGTAQAQALLVASAQWEGDTSGVRRVKSHTAGLVALLELPQPASGLAVFSQDGRIIRKLNEDAGVTSPARRWWRVPFAARRPTSPTARGCGSRWGACAACCDRWPA